MINQTSDNIKLYPFCQRVPKKRRCFVIQKPKPFLFLTIIFFLFFCGIGVINSRLLWPKTSRVSVGMDKKIFTKIYPKAQARTYRQKDTDEWLTFDDPFKGAPHRLITFHLHDQKIKDWQINNRAEIIEEYLGEFSSQAFAQSFPMIGQAIRDVLTRMPFEDFLKITDRRRPVLFTEVFDDGTAKFANSSEIISMPDDAAAFQEGLTIIKLSTGLEAASNKKAVEGVIAHELAHRVLEHVKDGKRGCAAEREANRLIKQWGFNDEYTQASETFGQKAVGQTTVCHDEE